MLDPITNDSYHEVLTKIAFFLNCKLLIRKQKSTGNEYYTLAASSKTSLNIIINYFFKYPLFSSKYLDYKDWEKVAFLIIGNKHYTGSRIKYNRFCKKWYEQTKSSFQLRPS